MAGRGKLPLVVVLLLATVAYGGFRYAWYSGPYVLDRCEPDRTLRLDAFLRQIDPYLRRFHDPPAQFDPRDLRGRFSTRAGGSTDLYASADMVFVLWILGEIERRTSDSGRREWASLIQSFQDPRTGRFRPGEAAAESATHATAFATAALKLLGASPLHPHAWSAPLFSDPDAVGRWFDSFNWCQIWTGSHELGAVAAVIDAPQGVRLPAKWPDWVVAEMTERVDGETGFWKNGALDLVWHRPTTVDLGGAAHFWWIYHHLGRPVPHPEKVIAHIVALQRETGLWGTRLFNGAHPQGIDFDALNGLRLAWSQLSPQARSARRGRIVAALDRYACVAGAHLNADGSVERLFRTPHKLVGALNALAELDLLYREIAGRPKLETSSPLRSALTRVAWQ
jgi:hypothetical protein